MWRRDTGEHLSLFGGHKISAVGTAGKTWLMFGVTLAVRRLHPGIPHNIGCSRRNKNGGGERVWRWDCDIYRKTCKGFIIAIRKKMVTVFKHLVVILWRLFTLWTPGFFYCTDFFFPLHSHTYFGYFAFVGYDHSEVWHATFCISAVPAEKV